MSLPPEKLAFLRSIRPRAFRQGTQLAFTSPTWGMRSGPDHTFESYLPDLIHPTRGAIAMRDFANLASHALKPFFPSSDVLESNAIDDTNDPVGSVTWDPDSKTFTVHPRLRPLPGRVYALAADLSVTGDATGLAMTHLEPGGLVDIDFSLDVKQKPHIDYRPIEDLFVYLRDILGFTIIGVFFDQFQSHRTITILKEKGFAAEVVRYADSFSGCRTLSDIIHAGLLRYHLHRDRTLIGEAKELQSINDKRVDHMTSGGVYNSKDVWDAVVNAVNACLEADKMTGLRLEPTDIQTTPIDRLLEELNTLKAEKKKLPWVQFAHVYSRLDEEDDPNTFIISHVARSLSTPAIVVLGSTCVFQSLDAQVQTLKDHQEKWRALPFASSFPPYPCEISAESATSDILSKGFLASKSDFMLSGVSDKVTPEARIEVLKELIRRGVVQFPKFWETDPNLTRLVRKLLAHPYVVDNYEIRALACAVANAQELEQVDTLKSSGTSTRPSIAVKGW